VAQPRFRGSDLRRRCCGPVSAVDGGATIQLRGAGNGARLRGAPTQGTAGRDRPGALRRHWGRPVAQPWVCGSRAVILMSNCARCSYQYFLFMSNPL